MNLIRKSRLRFIEGNSNKVYEVDLCETPDSSEERFVVNFRYGRFGTNLREGTKTVTPVKLEKAQKIFDSIVVSKINKGYKDVDVDKKEVSTPEKIVSTGNEIKTKILEYLVNPPENWPLSRIIWRAGELEIVEAADQIAATVSDDNQVNYSIAWSLGRCGNESHLNAIETLQKSSDNAVKRISDEVYLHLASPDKVDQQLGKIKANLSNKLQQCIDNNNIKKLIDRLIASLSSENEYNIELLESIYTLAKKHPCCHSAIAEVLKTIPFKEQNYFKAFRHIFKISEFRCDSLVFGIIALRIEQTAGGWGKPFSDATKEYLRRRTWRTLRKLGEADDDQYVDMAGGILAILSDEHGKEPYKLVRTEWNYDRQRYEEVVPSGQYYKFSGYLAVNHIIHQNSDQYKLSNGRKFWYQVNETPDTARVEAFPELWDKHPEKLLELLLKSHCVIVHQFAIRVLSDNEEYCKTISASIIAQLLSTIYQETAAFAFNLAKAVYNPEQPDIVLLIACFSSTYTPAQEQAIKWIEAQPLLLKKNLNFLSVIIVSQFENVRKWVMDLLEKVDFSPSEEQILVEEVLLLIKKMDEPEWTGNIEEIFNIMSSYFESALKNIDLSVIEDLLANNKADIQILGAKLLLILEISAESIPEEFLAIINQSSNEILRSVGVSLLSKYSDTYLLNQHEMLFAYCVSESAPIRLAVRPIIKRLADANPVFADTLFKKIASDFFHKEASEGLHDDNIELIKTALTGPLKNIDKNLRWRLIHAKSKTAQKLGAISLCDAVYGDYSIKQWVSFANSSTQSVRQWVMEAFRSETESIRSDAGSALRILNSKWDDSREFGIEYFRKNFDKNDWNPNIIIGICDSTQDDVQRYGRELITAFFEEGDGVEYLMKLSQHPSRNVQLFTTNYLARYASDNLKRLQQLQPYFVTVLSNVCRGRVAKDRVTLFLLSEAIKSEAAAKFVAGIFNRQSVTYSLTDKATYIEAMCDIHDKYPDVTLQIQVKALPIKEYKKGVAHAI